MATWPVVSGNPVPSTNLNELNQRLSNTVEGISVDVVVTSEGTSSTTFTDLATAGPSVTVTLSSPNALVMIGGQNDNNSAGQSSIMSFTVTGASTLAADDNRAFVVQGTDDVQATRIVPLTTLSTGSNTFTAKYRVASGSTGTFRRRHISVFPLGG